MVFKSVVVVLVSLLEKAGNFTASFRLAIGNSLLALLSASWISTSLPPASFYRTGHFSKGILGSQILQAKDLLNA
jgi:hypothetical protein